MTFKNYFESKVKGQGHFVRSDKVKTGLKWGTWPIFTQPKQHLLNPFRSNMTVHPSWISAIYGLAWLVYLYTFSTHPNSFLQCSLNMVNICGDRQKNFIVGQLSGFFSGESSNSDTSIRNGMNTPWGLRFGKKYGRHFFKMTFCVSKYTFLNKTTNNCPIWMILVSNHIFLVMKNLNFYFARPKIQVGTDFLRWLRFQTLQFWHSCPSCPIVLFEWSWCQTIHFRPCGI